MRLLHPSHRQDYRLFYEEEMSFRSAMGYPPAGHMLMITAESADDEAAAKAMQEIREITARSAGRRVRILGPSRGMITRLRDLYRYVIYIKNSDDQELIRLRMQIEEHLQRSGTDKKIYFAYDLDPISLF